MLRSDGKKLLNHAQVHSKTKDFIISCKLKMMQKKKKKPKVLLAMSGGVDSSVAALMLKKQGFEIIGAFMKMWSSTKNNLGECAWMDEKRMAMKIALMLEIPFVLLDYEKEYNALVVEEMFSNYKKGITPNPDADCNTKIKFPFLLKAAKKFGCEYIATGHYAKVSKTQKRAVLMRAKDEFKDQTYFLYGLKQKELAKTLFPIGSYTKQEVRNIAKTKGLPNFDKKSTAGICFIGKVDMQNFLKKKISPKPGKVLDPEGNVIGEHQGIYFYTIGQRLGSRNMAEVKKSANPEKRIERWHVAAKDIKKNILIAAPKSHRLNYKTSISIKKPNWILGEPLKTKKFSVKSKIRHPGKLLSSSLFFSKKNKCWAIELKKPEFGVAEGQSIVVYSGKKVLGGGIISRT